jgi:hypothetical protein
MGSGQGSPSQALITSQSLCSLQIGEATLGFLLAVLSSFLLYRRSNGWEYADCLRFLFYFLFVSIDLI